MGNRISCRDVLRHRANGRSIREIAAACYCSSSAVQDILARADERGVGWDDVAPFTDDDARRLVRGNPGKGGAAFAAIDYERIDRETARDRTHFIIGERSFGTLSDSRGMVSASSWNGVHRYGTMSRLSCNNHGWFYRTGSNLFTLLSGSTIAYWASNVIKHAFESGSKLGKYVEMPYGFKTGDNERFLRLWWECEASTSAFEVKSDIEAASSGRTWFPYNKGGAFRKWYGNNFYVLNYRDSGREVLGDAKNDGRSAADYSHVLFFRPVVTWSRIRLAFSG